MFKKNIKDLIKVIIILVWIHIPIFIIAELTFLNRAIFNVDYLFSILILPFNFLISFIFFILTLFIEILVSGYHLFNFVDLKDVFYSLSFIFDTNLISLINLQNFLISIFIVFNFYIIKNFVKKKDIKFFVIIYLLFFLIDTFNSTNILSKHSKVTFNLNIFGSSFATIFDFIFTEKNNINKKYLIKDVKEKQIISSEEIKKFKEIENYSLVIIVLESFGKSSSSVLNQYIENHIKFKLNDEFKIKFLETKRYGHTMQGEIQILCNILINNHQSMKNFNFNKYDCLPNEIKNHNIKTYAYHGFSSKFFDRYKWWKNIGFDNRYFFNDLSDLQKKCGTLLIGKCDEDMIQLVFNDLRNENGFYYLLTLNTHYPYSAKLKNNKLKEICKVHKIEDAVCSIYQIYSDNLNHILYQINNSDKNLKVIITGDHKPPFTNKKENFYFTENIVPTIIITYEK